MRKKLGCHRTLTSTVLLRGRRPQRSERDSTRLDRVPKLSCNTHHWRQTSVQLREPGFDVVMSTPWRIISAFYFSNVCHSKILTYNKNWKLLIAYPNPLVLSLELLKFLFLLFLLITVHSSRCCCAVFLFVWFLGFFALCFFVFTNTHTVRCFKI